MKRIRAKKPKVSNECEYEFPLDPRDPDVLRVKQLFYATTPPRKEAESSAITVPTITLSKAMTIVHRILTRAPMQPSSGRHVHRTISAGIGHNLPQEAPQAFAEAVIEVDTY